MPAEKALIRKRIHPQVMRHTFTTTLLDRGNDLKTGQAPMGHSHIRTTETYLHSAEDRKVEAIKVLNFVFEAGSRRVEGNGLVSRALCLPRTSS